MVDGVILAAGRSTRMGLPKVFMEIDGVPIVQRVLTAAVQSALYRIVVVTGPGPEAAETTKRARMGTPRVTLVVNPWPEHGMSSSLRVGINALEGRDAGLMVLLGDQPWITSGVIDLLLEGFRRDASKIVVPTISGRRSTPVVFPPDLLWALRGTTGDVGGREVVNRHADRVVLVEAGDVYDDRDIDTPEDLDAARRKGIGFP